MKNTFLQFRLFKYKIIETNKMKLTQKKIKKLADLCLSLDCWIVLALIYYDP